MEKYFNFVVMMLSLCIMTVTASCGDDPEGKWDPMKWKATSAVEKSDGSYMVGPEGGEYTFECKNYAGFWFSKAVVKAGSTLANYYPEFNDSGNGLTLDASWAHFTSQSNQLTVTIDLNDGTDTRQVAVTVTAGDVFDTFQFCQQSKE
ncbi:MAG: hypothetical protein LUD17_09280 [Bacteroidales bacterium]|nr:hypothetical protein [Bacteroidales bacterium]